MKKMIALLVTVSIVLSFFSIAASANVSGPFTVSGGDISQLNGVYTKGTDYNGKTFYWGPGGGPSVYWSGSAWELKYNYNVVYYSNSTSNDPNPPTDGWKLANGSTDSNFKLSYGPTFSVPPTASVNENDGSVSLTVSLSEPFPFASTVNYSIQGISATDGSDFSGGSGQIFVNGDSTSTTLSVGIINDSVYENDETFTVTLSNPSNGAQIANGTCTVTIVSEDPQPTVGFSASTLSVPENGGATSLPVVLSNPSAFPVEISYGVTGGTAVQGLDYLFTPGRLTIPAGTTTANIPITLLDNSIYQGDKNLSVTLFDPVGASLGTQSAAVTIADDEPAPTVTAVQISPASANVQKGSTFQLSASVLGENTPPQTILWSVLNNTSSETSIDGTGLLTVSAQESSPVLKVTATSGYDTTKKATADVTVEAVPGILVEGNPTSPVQSAVLQLNVTATTVQKVEAKVGNGDWHDITSSYISGYPVTSNGNYTFRVTNGAGVTAEKTVSITQIDTTPPIVNIASGGYTGGWTNENVTVTLSNTAINMGTTTFEFSKNGGTWSLLPGGNLTISDEGVTNLLFRAVSQSGIVSFASPYTVKIDKVSPANVAIAFAQNPVRTVLHFLTFGQFFQDTVDGNLSATDGLSGVDHFEYQAVPADAVFDENGTWHNGGSFQISPDFKGKLYARAVDQAGNKSGYIVRSMAVDKTKPVIQAQYADAGSKVYNRNTGIAVTAKDATAGLRTVSYQIGAAAAHSIDLTTQTYTDPVGQYLFPIDNLPNGVYDVVINAIDLSGNAADSVTIHVDKATVTGIKVTPPSSPLHPGDSISLSAVVAGENNPSQAIEWTVSGNTSSKTKFGTDGNLTIGADETASQIKVTAASKAVNGYSASILVPIISNSISDSNSNVVLDLSKAVFPTSVTTVSVESSKHPGSGSPSTIYSVVTDLIGSKNELGKLQNLAVYDLWLVDQNKNTIKQFDGTITVKIPIPAGMSGNLRVFWYDPEKGSLTDMNAVQENGCLTFQTNHFSIYTIAQLGTSPVSSSAPEGSPSPSTGSKPLAALPAAILSASVLAGMIFVKRRERTLNQ